jgi:CheY-like chemotaxis protein
LVDDEPQLLRILGFALEFEGYRVLSAENTDDALGLAQLEPIDAVITDYRMPGGSGITLLTDLATAGRLPVVRVLMTGVSDFSKEKAISLGFTHILTKPFELPDLNRTLNEAFGQLEASMLPEDRIQCSVASFS